MITEAKRTGRHTWRGGVGRDRAQRAERLKQREEEPAKDTEKEHRGKEAGGRTRRGGPGRRQFHEAGNGLQDQMPRRGQGRWGPEKPIAFDN